MAAGEDIEAGPPAERLDDVIAILRAVGEPTRLRILALLRASELTVSEITAILGQSQPRASRHLKLLWEAGVVERAPEGAWVFHRLAEPGSPARRITEAAIAAAPSDDLEMARDARRLARVRAERAAAAASYFEAVAADWDRVRALHLDEAEVEAAMVEAAGEEKPDVMIDLGTGTGRILQMFAPRVRRGYGVDLSRDMLRVARANLDRPEYAHCAARLGDLYALPFPDGAADLVTVHQVLHFLDDPGAALREAARVTAPGGRLLIVDYAPHGLEFLRERHAHRRLGFSDEDVAGWLARAGLRVEAARSLPPQADEGLTVKIWRARADASPRSMARSA